ncbi:MAG: hypothetical protein IJV14_19200 [Lachnospiraceae bacterium]|nr:hypothetical protein [Lachnospiraceae bacterium]
MSDFIIPLSIQDEQTLYSSFDHCGDHIHYRLFLCVGSLCKMDRNAAGTQEKERILNLLSEAEMRVKKGEENDKTEALPTATGRSSMKWCRSTSPL